MKDQGKTKTQIIEELKNLRQQIDELQKTAAGRGHEEAALRASEEELRAAYENAPLIMMLIDKEWRIRKSNNFFAQFACVPIADIIDMRCGEAFHCIHALDTSEGCGFGPSCRECLFRLTILDTIETGRAHPAVEVGISLADDENGREATFLLSTTKLTVKGEPLALVSIQDITWYKRAQEELRASEERYRLIFENSGDAILLTAPDGRIFAANSAACRIFGRTETEICWMGRDCVVDPTDPRLPVALEERRRTGRFRGELSFLRSDGQPFPGELTSVVFQGEDGQMRTSMIIRDITESKLMEEALRRDEERIRIITDNVPALVSYIDREGNYRFVNSHYREWFGIPETGIIGKHYKEMLGESVSEKIETHVKAALSGQRVSFEEYLQYALGGERWVYAQYVPDIDDYGEVRGFFGLVTDITGRKRAEEALHAANAYNRSLIEAGLDPLVIIGLDGRITDVNAATEAVTGYGRAELIGKNFSDYFTDPEKAHAGYQEVFRKGSLRDYPLEIKHRDKHVTSVLYNASVYRNDAGDVVGVFAAARDITERKRADKALREKTNLSQVLLDAFPCVALLLRSITREIVSANKAGIQVGAIPGAHCFDTWGQRKDSCPWCLAPELWTTGKSQHLEVEASGVVWDAYWIPVSDDIYMHFAMDITERKQAEKELKEKVDELERFNELVVGRELRIIELKSEINELLKKAGEPQKYRIPE